MERMAPNGLSGAFDQAYLANYTGTVNYITSNGGWAIIDPHNYGRYNGAIISDITGFQTFWQNLASVYKNNAHAVSSQQ